MSEHMAAASTWTRSPSSPGTWYLRRPGGGPEAVIEDRGDWGRYAERGEGAWYWIVAASPARGRAASFAAARAAVAEAMGDAREGTDQAA